MARPTPPPRELTYVPLSRLLDDTTFRLRQSGDVSSLARSIAQAGQLFPIEVRAAGDAFQAITGFRRVAALRLLHRDRVLVRLHPELGDEAAALIAAADALDSLPLDREDLLEMRERYRSMGWSNPALEELVARALEKAEERLEDLAAQLQGLPPPDRTVADEDGDEDVGRPSSEPAPQPEPGEAEVEVPPPVVTRDLEGVPRPTPRTLPGGIAEPPEEPPGAAPLGRAPTVAAGPRVLGVEDLALDVAGRLSLLSQDLATLAPHLGEAPPSLRRIVTEQLAYYRQLADWIEQAPGDLP